ncbi:MAG: polymer-forming cytoskeletal protein [Clostridiales bacterium]|nr:polymer-forming cytoskeletal protein [Clostridiales bacterium]
MAWNDDLKQAFKETLYGSDAKEEKEEIKASDEPPKVVKEATFETVSKEDINPQPAQQEENNVPEFLASFDDEAEEKEIDDNDISSFVDAINNSGDTFVDISSGNSASSFTSSADTSAPLNSSFAANSSFGASTGDFNSGNNAGGSGNGGSNDNFMSNMGFPNAPAKKTIIADGTIIRGSLESDGMVDMDGTIIGDLACKSHLSVTGKIKGGVKAEQIAMNNAKVQGNISAVNSLSVSSETQIAGNVEVRDAIIEGYIKGNVAVVQDLTVCSDSVLMGDITVGSIEVQRGAVIDGKVSMIGEHSLNRKAALDKLKFEIEA